VGGGVGDHRGGILGLLRVLDGHGEAIRADLFNAGRSLDDLGSPGFSWIDLRAFLRWSPPTSAFSRSFHGEELIAWSDPKVHLLATIADLLAGANWQRGGSKGSKPKPIQRPGDRQKLGGRQQTVMDIDALDEFLGWSPRTK
jgi:hypothetical protein